MKMRSTLLGSLVLALSATSDAQTITRVDGEAAGPGTLIAVEGTNLGGTTHVRFRAFVGGFVGVWDEDAPVVGVTPTRVTVLVPDVTAGWIPPGPQEGSPFGELRAVDASSVTSNVRPFYFFEGTNGFLENAGLGTTQSNGLRSTASFTIAGGPPSSGNATFTPTLHHAVPGAVPLLAAGVQVPPFPFGDGLIALNPFPLLGLFPGSVVDVDGNAAIAPLPLPPIPPGTNLALQWGYVDPGTSTIAVSNAVWANF